MRSLVWWRQKIQVKSVSLRNDKFDFFKKMLWGVDVEPVGARSLRRKVISRVPNCIFLLVYLKAVYFNAVNLASVVPNQSSVLLLLLLLLS